MDMRLHQILDEGIINSAPVEKVLSSLKNNGINAQKKGKRITLPDDVKIDNILNSVGWYIAYQENNQIIIEPKYGLPINHISDILYHATEEVNVDKIMRIGLVPKSKNRMSAHPDRIYAAISQEIAMSFAKHFIHGLYSPHMLSIDTQKTNNKWYEDPNLEGGVFTTTNVPPNALTRVL